MDSNYFEKIPMLAKIIKINTKKSRQLQLLEKVKKTPQIILILTLEDNIR